MTLTMCSASCPQLFAADSSFQTSKVLMVPPIGFSFNPQTAVSNHYQKKLEHIDVTQAAICEFDGMVATLVKNGIEVLILNQPSNLPDAVFPNNWFSTHINENGKTDVIVYPVLTPNRQLEVNEKELMKLLANHKIKTERFIDMRLDKTGILEGTGSMILDREHRVLYASLSERTSLSMVKHAAKLIGDYEVVAFTSYDKNHRPIYHTNVMMGIGHQFAVVCLECIQDKKERKDVETALIKTGKTIVAISLDQVLHMCGNVMELKNKDNQYLLVMSQQAYDNFSTEQRALLEKYTKLVSVNLSTIETVGGGSARCMIAEVFG